MIDDDDQVGYGRPPKATRFVKGVSGNPSGRPKAKSEPARLNTYEELLSRTLIVKINGAKKRVSMKQALEARIIEGCVGLGPIQLLKILKELELEVVRAREAAAAVKMKKADAILQECAAALIAVRGLKAIGFLEVIDGQPRVKPGLLDKVIDVSKFSTSHDPDILILLRYAGVR